MSNGIFVETSNSLEIMGSELLVDKNDLNSYGSGKVNYKRIPGKIKVFNIKMN